MFPSLEYPHVLSREVLSEFDGVLTQLRAFLQKEHRSDGSHGTITTTGIFESGRAVGLGQWADVPYRAGNFTANGTMTWGVDAADVAIQRYTRIGSTLHYHVTVLTSDVGGVANTALYVALPFGLRVAAPFYGLMRYSDAGGATAIGYAGAAAGDTVIALTTTAGANWTITAADDTAIAGSWTLEVA